MKMRFPFILVFFVTSILVLAGCDLQTDMPVKTRPTNIGKDLIIDEVFTLDPSKYYAYSWVEIHNPSTRTISWFNETFPITGHMAGSNGTILRTESDGDPWNDIYPGPESWNGIHFPYPDTGIAVGDNGEIRIIHNLGTLGFEFLVPGTIPPSVAGVNLHSVSGPLISPTAYIVGDGGLILRTTNRGAAWLTPTNGSGTTKNLQSVYFESFQAVYVCGDSGIVMKSPRTNQWDKKILPDAYLTTNFKAIFSQGTSEILVGENGTLLISRNAGENWIPETTGVSSTLRGIYYNRTYNRAWAVGDDGTILRSFDSLRTWFPQSSGVTASLRTIAFTDSAIGWAAGAGGTVIRTTDGGEHWVQQSSGTTETLNSISLNPPAIRIRDRLVVEMHAKRKTFFQDPTAPQVPGVNPNFDFIVHSDTGSVFFDPGLLKDIADLRRVPYTPPDPVPPQGWVILKSDSVKFQDHSNVGPGNPQQLNFAISFTDTSLFRTRAVLWDLLESGEVRLIRIYRKEIKGTGEVIGPQSTETVDVVRWGGYRPDPAVTPPELMFPNNEPAGAIPEWYSLSRYVNDLGGDVNVISTSTSFYMANQPIPGWYSQRGK